MDEHPVYPLTVEAITEPRIFEQVIEARYKADVFGLLAFVTLSKDSIEIIALTELGIQAYSLNYDPKGLRFNTLPNLQTLVPEYVLFDFQLCYADVAILREVLGAAGYQFVQDINEQGWTRTIRFNGDLVYVIERKGNSIILSNLLRDYEYKILENNV